MNSQTQKKLLIHKEPYRLFFPLGVVMLLWGALIWLSQIWGVETYPVLLHRYLMLNGFSAFFVTGFLMTAVPKFSQTKTADLLEIYGYLSVFSLGLLFSFFNNESYTYLASGFCGIILLSFLLRRILTKKVNPPYSFLFIFVGLLLWIFSSFISSFLPYDSYKNIHSEGAMMAIILGVGSRLIPGILGHVEVVQTQRAAYETNRSFLATVPLVFFFLIASFVGSYFLSEVVGNWIRLFVVGWIAFAYWRLLSFPKERSALTWNIWCSSWMIVISFFIRAIWIGGGIHVGHSFFFGGIVLLSFLIATRVLQSHGPGDKRFEERKILYLVSFLVLLAGATRVSAVLMEESYYRHLGYSSFTLVMATLIWSFVYLPLVRFSK